MNIVNRSMITAVFMISWLLLSLSGARAAGEKANAEVPEETTAPKPEPAPEISRGKFTANPFHITAGLRAGYDDNVNLTSTGDQGSAFVTPSLALNYKFGSPRTRLTLTAGGSLTYYLDRKIDPLNIGQNSVDQDYDINANFSFDISHRATPRLTLTSTVYASYQTLPSFDTFNRGGLGFSRENQDFFYSNSRFSVSYLWTPKFVTITSYNLGIVDYDSEVLSIFQDRFEHNFGNEFRFLIWPLTTLVAEYRFGIIDYMEAGNRGSTSSFFLGGFDHNFNPRFSISARGGMEFRQFDSDSVNGFEEGDRTSPYAEATLKYSVAQRMIITWTNRYSLEEPDVPTAFSRTTFRSALAAQYSFTTRIIGNLSVGYENDQNEGGLFGTDFNENAYDASLSLRYVVNRTWAFDLGFQHTEVISDDAFREFARNRIYTGATFTW